MGFIKLNIPVLVRQIKTDADINYHLQPLFTGHPSASHRRFELAINQLKKELKYYFRSYTLSADTKDEVLWYMFNPELEYYSLDLSINLGKRFIKGRFGAALFTLKNQQFVCLPSFNNYMFMLPKEGKSSKIQVEQHILRVVHQLFKALRDHQPDFDAEDYFSTKGRIYYLDYS